MKINLDNEGFQCLNDILAMNEQNQEDSSFFNEYLSLPTKEKRKVDIGGRLLNPSEYKNNPYFKLLSNLRAKRGNITYEMDHYDAGERFLYKEIESAAEQSYREINPYGYFANRFDFPTVKKDDVTWMSLIPHEIHTMERAIAEARGNVMTLGLGLGYYAFMAASKKEVTNVDVVENDKNVIALFRENILPKIPDKAKIHIIQGDAFEALAQEKKQPHDYVYFDIYHNEEDALPLYIKGKETFDAPDIHYWIEGSILVYFRRYVSLLLEEELEGSEDEDYPDSEDFTDHVFHRLHLILKDVELKTPEDIHKLLSDAGLKSILKKI